MKKYLDISIYILLTAISFVFIEKLIEHINPILALAVMSLCGIVVFNFLNYRNTRHTYYAIVRACLLSLK